MLKQQSFLRRLKTWGRLMGFKVDTSFLRFLTMGALGVHRVSRELRERGFEPIELERYCGSNKIWATKVKRLRLPDLLCVRTGLRLEVRAKTDLKIRMSDAPTNPERAWDAGLCDDDIVAFIACVEGPDGPIPADETVFFSVRSLRDSVDQSKLGVPKSASEGAERDRTWPATVPSRPGRVVAVAQEKLVVMMEGDGNRPRRQTYTLNGKHVYVSPGDQFQAGVTILAGVPESLADLDAYRGCAYHPMDEILSGNAVDRYAAVKALRFRPDLHEESIGVLEELLESEPEERVALEAAGTAAALGSAAGRDRIAYALWGVGPADLSMEAILILTELNIGYSRVALLEVAHGDRFRRDERRQAAVWGLGKAGLRAYGDLVDFIGDEEENVAYHAIAGFGPDTPRAVIEELVAVLLTGDPRRAPAASEALRIIGSEEALESLVETTVTSSGATDWVLATIGRMRPDMVQARLNGTALLDQLAPMLLIADGANWLSTEDVTTDIAFLLKQNL